MLYATTRNKTDTYTAYRALREDRAPDGGFFIPFRSVGIESLEALTDQPFNAVLAQVLDMFFPGRLTLWDVDCSIGKSAVTIHAMSHRVLFARLWNNPAEDASFIYKSLYNKLCRDDSDRALSDWAALVIKIAVLFGLYSQLKKQNIRQFDIAVNAGDFNTPMAVWYARKMGLPIGTIICGCNENSTPWDFLHRGELNTAASVVSTVTKELDFAYPAGLERLIYETLGMDEVERFLRACEKRSVYRVRPDLLQLLNQGIFASVIGNDRVESVISSVYRSNRYILDPYTAVCYGSLQDYRSKTGESCPTVLLSEKSPLRFAAVVQRATGISDIKKILD